MHLENRLCSFGFRTTRFWTTCTFEELVLGVLRLDNRLSSFGFCTNSFCTNAFGVTSWMGLLQQNIFVIPILTNEFVGIKKPFIPCDEPLAVSLLCFVARARRLIAIRICRLKYVSGFALIPLYYLTQRTTGVGKAVRLTVSRKATPRIHYSKSTRQKSPAWKIRLTRTRLFIHDIADYGSRLDTGVPIAHTLTVFSSWKWYFSTTGYHGNDSYLKQK